MDIDLDELKRLALAATPGPWKWWTSNSELRLTGADLKDGGVLHAYKHSTWADISCSAANQDFIAAANPAAILKLIAEIDRLSNWKQIVSDPENQPNQLSEPRWAFERIEELERENAGLRQRP
jgi:hypothetical protein